MQIDRSKNATHVTTAMGPFKCYVTPMGVGSFFREKALRRCKVQRYYRYERVGGGPISRHYEGVRFNVICVTIGWVEVQFPGKKRYLNGPYEQLSPNPHLCLTLFSHSSYFCCSSRSSGCNFHFLRRGLNPRSSGDT